MAHCAPKNSTFALRFCDRNGCVQGGMVSKRPVLLHPKFLGPLNFLAGPVNSANVSSGCERVDFGLGRAAEWTRGWGRTDPLSSPPAMCPVRPPQVWKFDRQIPLKHKLPNLRSPCQHHHPTSILSPRFPLLNRPPCCSSSDILISTSTY